MSAFNTGWKFHLGDAKDAWKKGCDDSGWREVTIPHDWSVESPFDKRFSSGTGYLSGGVAFYRKTFNLPKQVQGKNISVTFDGIYKNAQVWVNGSYLGYRPYGYTTFCFDISEFCLFDDDENVIVVKVSHEDIADSRWFTGSGIYRKVSLNIREREHIKDNGVFIWTERADVQSAVLCAEVSVDVESMCEVIFTVLNHEGETVANEQTITSDITKLSLIIDRPRLWSPDNPYLYKVVTKIQRNGEVIDCVTGLTGIRMFAFDAESGFTLNDSPMKIKGVCVHHDAGCLGAAVPAKVWRNRLNTFKTIGVNAIRTAHNPPMPELLDLCDEMGFLVIDEAFDEWEGCKNKWTTGHNVYPPQHYGYYEHFPEWHEFDLTAMVLRDRNHPSIIMWSVGNEIDYPNDPYGHPLFKSYTGNNDANKPATELQYNPDKPNAERLPVIAKKLVTIVKQLDTSRPVTAAVAFPELSNLTGYSECFDVIGYNYKEFLYADIHREHPDWVILGSENSHGYDEWIYVRDNPYISGQFLWTGIDFLGETKVWPCHGSHSGILDLAGMMKPGAYYRKSLWTEQPMAKLFTREPGNEWSENWNFSNGLDVEVICFTNGKRAELFLNNVSLGSKDSERNTIVWNVPFKEGTLRVVTADGAVDDQETVSAPVAIRLETDDEYVNANGQDIAIIRVAIIDNNDRITDDATHRLYTEVTGGHLLGMENGDLNDTQEYNASYRRAYNGKLTLYVRADDHAGVMSVRVYSEKLKSAYLEINKRKTE